MLFTVYTFKPINTFSIVLPQVYLFEGYLLFPLTAAQESGLKMVVILCLIHQKSRPKQKTSDCISITRLLSLGMRITCVIVPAQKPVQLSLRYCTETTQLPTIGSFTFTLDLFKWLVVR